MQAFANFDSIQAIAGVLTLLFLIQQIWFLFHFFFSARLAELPLATRMFAFGRWFTLSMGVYAVALLLLSLVAEGSVLEPLLVDLQLNLSIYAVSMGYCSVFCVYMLKKQIKQLSRG